MVLTEVMGMVIVTVVCMGAALVFIGSIIYKKYVIIPYKNNVIKKYLLEIDPNIEYFYEENSQPFKQFNNKYHLINSASSYQISDIIIDDAIKSFDLTATHTQSTGKSTVTITDFKGRFYIVDIPSDYLCDFILKEEKANRAPDGFKLLDLELTVFNKKFNLYVSDALEAQHYFRPYAIKRLVELEKSLDGNLIFAYIGKKLYCGVNDNSNFFEHLKTKEDVKKEYLTEREKIKGFKELICKGE